MGKSESSADEVAAEEVGAAGVPEVTPPPTGPPAEDDGRAKKPSFALPCFPRSDKDLNIAADDSPREGDAAAPAPQKGFKLSLPWKKGAGEAVAPGEDRAPPLLLTKHACWAALTALTTRVALYVRRLGGHHLVGASKPWTRP